MGAREDDRGGAGANGGGTGGGKGPIATAGRERGGRASAEARVASPEAASSWSKLPISIGMSMLDALSGGGSWSTAIGWYGVQLSSSFGWGRGAGAAIDPRRRCQGQ